METTHEPAAVQFLRRVLRPLMRIAVRSGLSAQDVIRLVCAESVAAAEEMLTEVGRSARATDISAATGLSRVAVRAITLSKGRRSNSRGLRRANPVLAAWHEDPVYLDRRRRPAVLPMHGAVSFTSLALAYGKDTTPKAILKDLLNAGAARHLDDGRLRALSRTLSPIVPDARFFDRESKRTFDLLQRIDERIASVQRSAKGIA